jgi:hypothetical protein
VLHDRRRGGGTPAVADAVAVRSYHCGQRRIAVCMRLPFSCLVIYSVVPLLLKSDLPISLLTLLIAENGPARLVAAHQPGQVRSCAK